MAADLVFRFKLQDYHDELVEKAKCHGIRVKHSKILEKRCFFPLRMMIPSFVHEIKYISYSISWRITKLKGLYIYEKFA